MCLYLVQHGEAVACDGWQAIERDRRLTRRCCELLLEYGFQVHVLTKSDLILRDLELFVGQKARVGVTVTTLDEAVGTPGGRRTGSFPGAGGSEPPRTEDGDHARPATPLALR